MPDRHASPFGDVHSAYPTTAAFSPDGGWVTYGTSEPYAIWVQPFPAGARIPIPIESVSYHPLWSPSGSELFYVNNTGQLIVQPLETHPAFSLKPPLPVSVREVFRGVPPLIDRTYDVTGDGRILATARSSIVNQRRAPDARFEVVLNWLDELKERVPTP
jgi:hypothetical protein